MKVQSDKRLKEELTGTYLNIYVIGNQNGLRVSDILKLQVKHIRKYRPTIREQKTGKSKRIYIPAKIRKKMLEETACKSDSDWLFPSPTDPTKPLRRQSVYNAFRAAELRLGNHKHVGTHTMRKNYAKELLRNGKSISEIRKKLNHKYDQDTLRYVSDIDLTELLRQNLGDE